MQTAILTLILLGTAPFAMAAPAPAGELVGRQQGPCRCVFHCATIPGIGSTTVCTCTFDGSVSGCNMNSCDSNCDPTK
ncbi:hypothetical protein V8C37DRAFT_397139 [Trichoderma ceciliae]